MAALPRRWGVGAPGGRNRVWRSMVAVAPTRAWAAVLALVAGAYAYTIYRYSFEKPANGLFRGDARWYAYLAYRDLGYSRSDAIHAVAVYLLPKGIGVYPQTFAGLAAEVTKTRVLYSAASAPFVALFGIRGMLVVPALATLFTALALCYLACRLFGARVGLVVTAGWLLSYVVMLWSVPALTEGLTIALMTAGLLVLPLRRAARARDPVVFGVLVVALAFTRQAAAMAAGAVILAWLWEGWQVRRWRGVWWPFAVSGFVAFVLTSVVSAVWAPFNVVAQMKAASGASTLAGALAALPRTALFIVRHDGAVILRDPIMVLVLVLVVLGVLTWFRSLATALLLGATLPYVALNLLNGTPSGFRYAAPVFPYFFLAAAALVVHWAGWANPLGRPSAEHPEPVGGVVQHGVEGDGDRLGEQVVHAQGGQAADDEQGEQVVHPDEHQVAGELAGQAAGPGGEHHRPVQPEVDGQAGGERDAGRG